MEEFLVVRSLCLGDKRSSAEERKLGIARTRRHASGKPCRRRRSSTRLDKITSIDAVHSIFSLMFSLKLKFKEEIKPYSNTVKFLLNGQHGIKTPLSSQAAFFRNSLVYDTIYGVVYFCNQKRNT
jgi:hypothetical protein